MAKLADIENHANTLLNSKSFSDYCPNGIQVRGRENIRRIVTGVSCCADLFQEARKAKADLILTHHGLFWDGDDRVLQGSSKRRLKILFDNEMSLMSYHLPLDAHPKLGNNAQIIDRLGLEQGEPFGNHRGQPISFIGKTSAPTPFSSIAKAARDLFGGEPLILPAGPEFISRIAVCSGAAPDLVREAKAAGADMFITGEPAEYVYHYVREEKMHFVAAGHHRTETFGVRALGDALAEEFKLEHLYVDIPNPI